MKTKFIQILSIIVCLAAPTAGQLPAHLFNKEKPTLKLSAADCTVSAPFYSVLAVSCNGVSVTPVNLSAATRTIISGTNNTVGVVYRYSNVGTAPDGTVLDAIVTVLSYSNNQDADQTNYSSSDIPGSTTGFENNLQPNLNQESGTHQIAAPWTGNITYRIQFVVTGTSTPRTISVAATSVDNDGSGACGGLRERVTYSAGFTQILLNNPTNQTIAGNVVIAPLTTQAGIGLGANFANSALYVNVSQFDWTYGFTTAGNCTAGSASEVRYGSLNLNCQIAFTPNFATVALSGTVFNDTDGLTDSTVDGTGTGMPSGTQLFANLVDSNGVVYASVPVAANGTYSFPAVVAGSFTVRISTTQGVESNAAPANTLPPGWVNTGENLGTGTGNDGTVDGSLPVTIGATAVTNANFGIEQRPTANNNTAAIQTNPGGTNNATVPPSTFSATDPAPGMVSSIRITAFPSNATTITINGIQYTAASFPPAGVTVPTNAAGNPTQPILVDPIDGTVTVGIPYVAIDNAGVASSTPATASVPFMAPTAANASVSGRVSNSLGRGIAGAVVVMTDETGNTLYAITNPFGYYRFMSVPTGQTYVASVRSKRSTFASQLITVTDDISGFDFVAEP